MIPEPVREWAQQRLDRPIVDITPVGGGLTDTISAVRFADGDPVVLRHVDIARWGEVGRQHIICEALGCRLMVDSKLPTPRLIASDSTGETGAYVSLTSWLPGQVRLGPLGVGAIRELARAAAVVHATQVPEQDRPRAYVSWAPAQPEVPTWTSRPELWERAIAIGAGPAPSTRPGLLHRDFHPGNVLWIGDTITGLIDWAETSWGPVDLDIAHAVTNFAMLHDLNQTEPFLAAYAAAGGRLDADPAARRFWQLTDILGFLPDPAIPLAAIVAARPELDADGIRAGLEDLLAATLG